MEAEGIEHTYACPVCDDPVSEPGLCFLCRQNVVQTVSLTDFWNIVVFLFEFLAFLILIGFFALAGVVINGWIQYWRFTHHY